MAEVITIWLVAEVRDEADDSKYREYDLDLVPIAGGNTPEDVFKKLSNAVTDEDLLDDLQRLLPGHIEQMNTAIEEVRNA